MKKTILILVAFAFIGCKKPKNSTLTFWIDYNTSQDLINDGALVIQYYVDGDLLSTELVDDFLTSAPDCITSAAQATIIMGDWTKEVGYQIAVDGVFLESGTYTMYDDECENYQFVY